MIGPGETAVTSRGKRSSIQAATPSGLAPSPEVGARPGDGPAVVVALFGGLTLEATNGTALTLPGHKARALLGYLAANPGIAVPRAKLATLLWGDRPDRQARDSLKQAVWQLRRCFESHCPTLLRSDRQSVTLEAAAATVDVVEFGRLLGEGTPQAVDEAIAIYRGDFLEGLESPDPGYEEWLLMERQRLRHLATEAMGTALARLMAGGQRDRAAVLAQQLLLLDPHNEAVCRALMQVHAARGERNKALALYESLSRRLVHDLGVAPEPATVAVCDAIRHKRAATVLEAESKTAAAELASSQTITVIERPMPTVAVLPFVNIGDDPEQAYFAEGLTEDVITDLSQLSGLATLIHRPAEARVQASPLAAAHALGATHVLEGSVRKLGSRIRITARLFEAASASCIWARRYDRDVSDIFALQEEMSLGIADALRVSLLPAELQSLATRPTDSVEAYQLCLLARSFYLRGWDKRSLRIAYDLFSKAAGMDPNYGQAHATKAICEALLCGNDPAVTAESMLAASDHAIALAPDLGEAHAAKGLSLYVLGRYTEAIDWLDRAMALDPSLFEAPFFKARCYRLLGQRKPAVAEFEKAAEIRPQDYRTIGLLAEECHALGFEREFRAAAARALRHASHEVKRHPENADAWASGSTLLVELGEKLRGEEWARRATIIGPDDYLVRYNVSRTLALLGNLPAALDVLAQALGSAPAFRRRLLAWMPLDQALDPLRGHARFDALITAAAAAEDAPPAS